MGCRRLSFILFACMIVIGAASHAPAQAPSSRPPGVADVRSILDRHERWLTSGGSDGARADLRGFSSESFVLPPDRLTLVGGLILRGVHLGQADVRFARLRNVDLTGADLTRAEFNETDLQWAILLDANLSGADFADANLRSAILREANLHRTVLTNADLGGADLTGARCLSEEQVLSARIDSDTTLPQFEECG